MELTKENYTQYVPFSKNITLSELHPYQQQALLQDVKPLLGDLAERLLSEEPADPFTADELAAREKIIPVWVLHAYINFLPFHGVNVTPAGLTKSKDSRDTYEHASAQERSAMLASFRTQVNYWEGELAKALKTLDADKKTYRRSNIGMRVIGAKRKGRGCGCNDDCRCYRYSGGYRA